MADDQFYFIGGSATTSPTMTHYVNLYTEFACCLSGGSYLLIHTVCLLSVRRVLPTYTHSLLAVCQEGLTYLYTQSACCLSGRSYQNAGEQGSGLLEMQEIRRRV